MVQFGHELRLEREQRRVSLEAMCASTKLSVRQLLDVEAGNFGELPGGIFRKGFVRSYLRALQLDEPFWLERFESSYRASGLAESQEPDWVGFAENVRNNRLAGKSSGIGRKWLGVLGMAVLVALLAACVWKFVLLPRMHTDQHAGLSQRISASPLPVADAPSQM
ncbi:cytoskeletal protein RodZ [Granulicella aggregans]|jgi:cytoskeleton protein RodZ|uniref:Cytoskeletal protein RodZ n=1 Tax=Granulicella aggregans TaxID=474949 RepID=A0A7W7ZBC9_9BACT|nr:helix-turn-helix domain-containing protein [Granulicella aggregans]MBB5056474.1 cytoskeletal protein RodZ [Granulicella aggregans]